MAFRLVQHLIPTTGAGCLFGNDVVHEYLHVLGLPHLVRSHQCVLKGFESIRVDETFEHHTVFSASNYCGSQNLGAVLVFSHEQGDTIRKFETWVPPAESNVLLEQKSARVINDTIGKIKQALETVYAEAGCALNTMEMTIHSLVRFVRTAC